MDPQQRLLLEVAWEALEHAGIPAEFAAPFADRSLRRGVLQRVRVPGRCGPADVDAWSNTGGALSIIANRLSYFLDLRVRRSRWIPPARRRWLRCTWRARACGLGDSELAIAAGVNLLLSPAVFHGFDQAGALSPTGLCHAFDAAADGFVRGEGCGVVVLKRLSEAVRDGDRVLAVVRGSAINQDGRSNGLMAPNPAAQTAVLRSAYAQAGVDPHEVDYVEAHGTGTFLGDPIEARALGTVLGRGRQADAPLLIGAVKSNLGHLEAAAGVAGFIKAVLAVQKGQIPANLRYENPNPHIPFDQLRLKVVAEDQEWPSVQRARRAGVSSFGFGGTNAHVVIEQAPDMAVVEPPQNAPVTTLVVSGKSAQRIASTAESLAEWMAGDGAGAALVDVAHALNHHRARHPQFATVCARNAAQAMAGLAALAAGMPADGVIGPHEGSCGTGTVFVYSGQGSQWVGMGRQLLADEPVFAEAVAELEPLFVEHVGFSLQQVLAEGESVSGDARVQPVIMGLQLALTELWRSHGVTPDAVIGHSMGEVSAAVVAGALTVAEGLKLIAIRSQLMSRLGGQGAVALLTLEAEATEAMLADYPGVTLAVYSSPRQTVVAGPPTQVDALITAVLEQGRFARRVNMEVASHNALMDPILPELRSALADLSAGQPGDSVLLDRRRRRRMPRYSMPITGWPTCVSRAVQPGGHRGRCRAHHVRRDQRAPDADASHHRNSRRNASPRRRYTAPRRRRHAEFPHQPQRHPHHAGAADRASTRATCAIADHAVGAHPPLDQLQDDGAAALKVAVASASPIPVRESSLRSGTARWRGRRSPFPPSRAAVGGVVAGDRRR